MSNHRATPGRWSAVIIGGVGAVGPLALLVGWFRLSGSHPAGLFPWTAIIGIMAGALIGPRTIRPRRRPWGSALAYALITVATWAVFGLGATLVEALAIDEPASELVVILIGRLAVAVVYGALLLVPVSVLGAAWVIATWALDAIISRITASVPSPRPS